MFTDVRPISNVFTITQDVYNDFQSIFKIGFIVHYSYKIMESISGHIVNTGVPQGSILGTRFKH